MRTERISVAFQQPQPSSLLAGSLRHASETHLLADFLLLEGSYRWATENQFAAAVVTNLTEVCRQVSELQIPARLVWS